MFIDIFNDNFYENVSANVVNIRMGHYEYKSSYAEVYCSMLLHFALIPTQKAMKQNAITEFFFTFCAVITSCVATRSKLKKNKQIKLFSKILIIKHLVRKIKTCLEASLSKVRRSLFKS